MNTKQIRRVLEKGQESMRIVLIGSLTKRKDCINSLRIVTQVETLSSAKKQKLASKLKKKMKKISKFHRLSEQIFHKLKEMKQSLRKKNSKPKIQKRETINFIDTQREEIPNKQKQIKIQDLIEQMSEQINRMQLMELREQSQNYFSRFEHEKMEEELSQIYFQ